MAPLDREQSAQLITLVTEIEQLMVRVDEDGAEEILDELYMLITKVLDRFPQLDRDEDD